MKKSALLLLIPVIALSACQLLPKQVVPQKTVEKTNEHMMDAKMAIQTDQEFLEMMIPHHQEAVDSSKVLLAKTQNADLKKFLEGVVDVQTKEIEQMKAWYKEWFKKDYVSAGNYMAMMPDLSKLEGEAADQAYIKGMMGHHQGAIDAAKQLQRFSKRYDLIKFATGVIEAQTKENELLATWLK